MAKPDLVNANVTPKGKIFGDFGTSALQRSGSCVENVTIFDITTIVSGTILTVPDDACTVFITVSGSPPSHAVIQLPDVADNIGRVLRFAVDLKIWGAGALSNGSLTFITAPGDPAEGQPYPSNLPQMASWGVTYAGTGKLISGPALVVQDISEEQGWNLLTPR